MDNQKMREEIYEYYAIVFGESYPISVSHRLGLGDLLDKVVEHFPVKDMNEAEEDVIHFSLIGRPNVGKSSLVNAILNEERVIVSDIEDTNRDAYVSSL